MNKENNELSYTIIIPAYNEASALDGVLKSLGKVRGCEEIIVVDDGSTDDTALIAESNHARVISHPYNMGYGAALKTGILAAKTEIVITYDADGQHRPEDLSKIVEKAGQYDMVVGDRGKDVGGEWSRRLGKKVLSIFANSISGHNIPDFNSGLRSFKVPVIKKYLHLMPDNFSMSTTSTFALLKTNHTICYVPIVTNKRCGRKSTVNSGDGLRVFMLILNLIILFNPQKIFISFSFLFFLLSIVYFIIYSITVRIHITESMILLFITGLIIFFMGIICEQISAIRREIYK